MDLTTYELLVHAAEEGVCAERERKREREIERE
jgi:hypothetical protein